MKKEAENNQTFNLGTKYELRISYDYTKWKNQSGFRYLFIFGIS
ncbi:hypothetical protein H1P_1700019 [Hyella patelloides LEGE 07179]|uniref:Uncharacterized protein n=1 Tax=Hyella patelloides LEGE 07179 TaxID=945734 RepID=A0A563VN80_9CYAN|nr:hypothetical protein H1P_1700019 [Hyella patelloides LEGE 07179]